MFKEPGVGWVVQTAFVSVFVSYVVSRMINFAVQVTKNQVEIMDLLTDQNFLQSLAKKVREDATFKKNLLESPLKTIEHFAGCRIIIPQGKKIAIVDQTDSATIFINLPSESSTEDVELNEEQLDIISGGGDGGFLIR